MQQPLPFRRVLVANRGEIARRVISTLDRLGIESVAVFSDGDAGAPHVREATTKVRIGPDPASESYLRVESLIEAAKSSGAEAIHPGYGFLAESVVFAQACEAAGIVFIGPNPHSIDIMGDKARSREHVSQAGVPIVPGFLATGMPDADIAARAEEIGFPILIKPSAGGGGKGMEIVHTGEALLPALESARRLAKSAFGDDTLIIERLIGRPRHIEVQVFGDVHGQVLALGERECTLQRRHQKVIEEAPSIAINADTRARLHEAAVQAARSVDYVGAGTVEFLIDADRPTEFFFIEMNTRLQVEHPVTELVTGLDLVEWQLRVAAGGKLPERAPDPQGFAVEARIYAETPERGFLPSVGRILRFVAPATARVDSAVETGSDVSPFYDPMIGKVIAHGETREQALDRLDAALADTVLLGVDTNIGFLRRLITNEQVRAGQMHTGLIDELLPLPQLRVSDAMLQVAARTVGGGPLALPNTSALGEQSLWTRLAPGWRIGADASGRGPIVLVSDDAEEFVVRVDAEESGDGVDAAIDETGAVWVCEGGVTVRLRPVSRRAHTLAGLEGAASAEAGPDARAPMPGAVTTVHVADGDRVTAGQALIAIEAMKMEHPVTAPLDGVVTLHVRVGSQVQRDDIVARVEP